MSNSIKTPPLTDDTNYQDWKKDLTIWQQFTELEKKQGPALYLSLSGKARECVRELNAADIGLDGGFNLITNKLDRVFQEDINLRTTMNLPTSLRHSPMIIAHGPKTGWKARKSRI